MESPAAVAVAWRVDRAQRHQLPFAVVAPQPQPVLRIGIVPDSPPLAFRQKRQWCGVEGFGSRPRPTAGHAPGLYCHPPARLADNLLSGKVDILMAGLTVTEERRTQMDFATPYVSVGQAAIIRAEDRLRYNTAIKIRTAGRAWEPSPTRRARAWSPPILRMPSCSLPAAAPPSRLCGKRKLTCSSTMAPRRGG